MMDVIYLVHCRLTLRNPYEQNAKEFILSSRSARGL
jgi:hypothetical protein